MKNKILILGTIILMGMLTGCGKQTEIPRQEEQETEVSNENADVFEIPALEAQSQEEEMNYFYFEEIDDATFERMKGKSFKDDCTTPREDLRLVHLKYVDFNDEEQLGEMVCNKAIAQDLVEIFEELYKARYQIERVELVDNYDADDEKSMAANNSSAFNFRFISFTTTVSKHGLGMAVDINPLYNPYVKIVNGKENVEPANAVDYVDRDKDFDHKICEGDLALELFKNHGFTWGGDWTSSKDYQHFEKD